MVRTILTISSEKSVSRIKITERILRRYVLLGVLVYTAPVAFSMGASQTTANIWKSWCRMLEFQARMRTKIKVISATAPLAHTPMMTSITELKSAKLNAGVEAEDPVKLSIRSVIFILLTLFSDEIVNIVLTEVLGSSRPG